MCILSFNIQNSRIPGLQMNCNTESLTYLSQIIQLLLFMSNTFFYLLFRHLYSRGWQRCPREVSWSWCTDWRWCRGDSRLTSHPFCRLPQRDEWHRTDMQQGLLTLAVARVQLRFKGGVRSHLCACAKCVSVCTFIHVSRLRVWWLYECMWLYVIFLCFK